MVRLVLFDIDGTLIRTGGAGVTAFAHAFEHEFGVPDATREMKFAGRTDPSLVREGFDRHRIDPAPENFRRFFDAYVGWLEKLLGQRPGGACPGVVEMIASLQNRPEPPRLGLLTGNIRRGAELKLGRYELWRHFEFGAFGDDHECRNELAAVAQRRGGAALGRSLAGDEILVIGDTPLDVACARSIGAKVLAVATGGATLEALRACGPTWAVETLAGLPVEDLIA